MQYQVESPQEYLSALEEDWRKVKLIVLRNFILDKEADIEELIQYKMLAYSINGKVLCHLNAQKNYVSLYVGDITKVDPDGKLTDDLNKGKGCIRFGKSAALQQTHIENFIGLAKKLCRTGQDLSC